MAAMTSTAKKVNIFFDIGYFSSVLRNMDLMIGL
jgi:hypothetical protein